MSECKNCGRADCPKLVMPTPSTRSECFWTAEDRERDAIVERAVKDCAAHKVDWYARAKAAEAKLAQAVERVKLLKQKHSPACFVKYSGCVCGGGVNMDINLAIDAVVSSILDGAKP